MTINDRIVLRFRIQYSNPEKTGYVKKYNESRGKSSGRTNKNEVGFGIKDEEIGTDFKTEVENSSGNIEEKENKQSYNVYNADFKVSVQYMLDYEGPIDMFRDDLNKTSEYVSRGTIETRNDKLHLY